MLLHGWLASAGLNWFTAFDVLGERYRVLAPDLRGHGRGLRTPRRFTLADCADDTAALLEQLDAGPVIAVGYSLGGPVAQLLWRRHPEHVGGLVLCATSHYLMPGMREQMLFGTFMLAAAGSTRMGMLAAQVPIARMRRIVPPGTPVRPSSMRAWARAEMRRHDYRHILEAGVAMSNYHARWIEDVDVPTSVVVTTKDRAINPLAQARMAFKIPGASIHRVDDGHIVCANREFGPTLATAVDDVARRIPRVTDTTTGPLRGVRVVELAGIGPAPFCCMVLADLGADVIRVDRVADVATAPPRPSGNTLDRARRSVAVDLKHPDGPGVVLRMVGGADILVEGFRPGVAERLGVGPDDCLAANGRLIYGRMTGWGQDGPFAAMAGHDIDYIALAGALASFGRAGGPPVPPLNVVGDFGGGGMLLALGVIAALFDVARGGEGQVVDAAMVDGTALLLAPFFAARQLGFWGERGTNSLDSGAPFYDCYETADGGWVAVGALEPQFYGALLAGLELDADALPDRDDQSSWPALRSLFAERFRQRPRAHWEATFGPGGFDACVAPVLDLAEAPTHPHVKERGTVVEVDGLLQPAAAPRFSRTPGKVGRPASYPGQHTEVVLGDAGMTSPEIGALLASGAVAQHGG